MTNIFDLNKLEVGKYFDYSVLPKQSTEQEIRKACKEAVKYNCAAFYTASPYWSPVVREELQGSTVLTATGIDFPFGVSSSKLKALETEQAVSAGCGAVDIVMNIGALRSGKFDVVREELRDFVKAAGNAITKVIIEVCFLSNEEIAAACKMIAESGANYAKTSTGQFEGPDMNQFLIMKDTLKDTGIKLKVAGVKFPRPQNAYSFILAGAELIGTRAAPEIIEAFEQIKEVYRNC
ncbi:MAG: deoxyribose-phosphate aldolase [Planctomycetaceae bacterium]|jgi:deoxyribose-phosphate aldolase|nr:deoxyribose-phosphate aldolase [Planctomycetaceae bacterium]